MNDTEQPRIRVLRVISRLNVGGPALHVAMLGRPSSGGRFESMLVTGTENPGEGTMLDFVRSQGIEPVVIPEIAGNSSLGLRDAIALWKLVRVIRRFRPHIIETHTAKAGFLGRLAGALTGVPVVIHTFHGHVLHGYYSPFANRLLRLAERGLAVMTTRIIAVSNQVRLDLIGYHVAAPDKIAVVPLGLDLDPFLNSDHLRGQLKAELGLPSETLVVGIVGRIFSIKNHALFVDAAARVSTEVPLARFVIVGDGVLRADIEERARRTGIGDRVFFTGWRQDVPAIYADLAILAVTSNNEGTPCSAIEAMAAGVPVVATHVGGLPDLIRDGETGVLVPAQDVDAMSGALKKLLIDADRRQQMGAAARADVQTRFPVSRMIQDTHALYEDCLRQNTQV